MFLADQNEILGVVTSHDNARSPYAPLPGREISLKYLHRDWDKFGDLNRARLNALSKAIHEIQEQSLDALLARNNYEKITFESIRTRRKLWELYPVEVRGDDHSRGSDCIKIKLGRKERVYMILDDRSETVYMLIIDPNHEIENTQS